MTISRKAFHQLKRGDIILWGKDKLPRIVEIGPANWRYTGKGRFRCRSQETPAYKRNDVIQLSKIRSSWTGRAPTTYHYTDLRDKIALPRSKRDKKIVRAWLNQKLIDQGIDPRQALIDEAKEMKRMLPFHKEWFGIEFVCSAGHKWPKEIET